MASGKKQTDEKTHNFKPRICKKSAQICAENTKKEEYMKSY